MKIEALFKQYYPNQLLLFAPDMGQWLPEGGLAHRPDILAIGKGASRLMKAPASAEQTLQERGVEVIAANTGRAWGTFNEQIDEGNEVVGAFQLAF